MRKSFFEELCNGRYSICYTICMVNFLCDLFDGIKNFSRLNLKTSTHATDFFIEGQSLNTNALDSNLSCRYLELINVRKVVVEPYFPSLNYLQDDEIELPMCVSKCSENAQVFLHLWIYNLP